MDGINKANKTSSIQNHDGDKKQQIVFTNVLKEIAIGTPDSVRIACELMKSAKIPIPDSLNAYLALQNTQSSSRDVKFAETAKSMQAQAINDAKKCLPSS